MAPYAGPLIYVFLCQYYIIGASLLVAQTVKNLQRPRFNPWVEEISWRRPGNLLQYSCLENPIEEKPGRLEYMGSQRVADG